MHSPQPLYGELFFTNLAPIFFYHIYLFIFVCTSFYLWEPLFLSARAYLHLPEFLFICQNMFLSVRTYFHLCALIICENLFLFMIIFENLFLFMIICENLFFFSLYQNNQAYEYHHLKQIFYHQKTIMMFC